MTEINLTAKYRELALATLKRNAIAIYQLIDRGDEHLFLVLYHDGSKFISHVYNASSDGKAHGHYYDGLSLDESYKRFRERLKQYRHTIPIWLGGKDII